ncbi:hypothetical protein C8R45DRAFT_1072535 [Mycena sanguinolenta]|nr:hypothetical protein C8R45DRAFT_1072535 [Mycena sanguinolenta]
MAGSRRLFFLLFFLHSHFSHFLGNLASVYKEITSGSILYWCTSVYLGRGLSTSVYQGRPRVGRVSLPRGNTVNPIVAQISDGHGNERACARLSLSFAIHLGLTLKAEELSMRVSTISLLVVARWAVEGHGHQVRQGQNWTVANTGNTLGYSDSIQTLPISDTQPSQRYGTLAPRLDSKVSDIFTSRSDIGAFDTSPQRISIGVVAGIVVAAITFLLCSGIALFWYIRRRRRRQLRHCVEKLFDEMNGDTRTGTISPFTLASSFVSGNATYTDSDARRISASTMTRERLEAQLRAVTEKMGELEELAEESTTGDSAAGGGGELISVPVVGASAPPDLEAELRAARAQINMLVARINAMNSVWEMGMPLGDEPPPDNAAFYLFANTTHRRVLCDSFFSFRNLNRVQSIIFRCKSDSVSDSPGNPLTVCSQTGRNDTVSPFTLLAGGQQPRNWMGNIDLRRSPRKIVDLEDVVEGGISSDWDAERGTQLVCARNASAAPPSDLEAELRAAREQINILGAHMKAIEWGDMYRT